MCVGASALRSQQPSPWQTDGKYDNPYNRWNAQPNVHSERVGNLERDDIPDEDADDDWLHNGYDICHAHDIPILYVHSDHDDYSHRYLLAIASPDGKPTCYGQPVANIISDTDSECIAAVDRLDFNERHADNVVYDVALC